MKNNLYEKLNAHFEIKSFNLTQDKIANKVFEKEYKDYDFADYPFGVGIYERKSKSIFPLHLSALNCDNPNEAFQYHLNQLPELTIHNLAMLIALSNFDENLKIRNAFNYPNDYPSDFAKSILKDSYGYILFPYHFYNLILSCQGENVPRSTLQLSDALRDFNKSNVDFFEKIKNYLLPDGTSFYKLLLDCTILKSYDTNNLCGLISQPRYNIAYKMLELCRDNNIN